MLLTIIVVSYNTKKMTLDCLDSIYKNNKIDDFNIIVFDNNSSDKSAEAIENRFPNIKLIKNTKNIGFAAANNYCADLVEDGYLLLLNPDTIILGSAIDSLLKFAKLNERSGIWGGRTLFADKTLNPSSCWKQMDIWNLFCSASGLASAFSNSPYFNTEAYGGWKRDSIKAVDIVSGCFFLIQKSLWDQLGGFDTRFFMYGEEADLCLRAKKLGFNPMVTNEAEIIHYGGASEKKRADKLVKLLKAKIQLIRNHWNPLIKDFGVKLLILWPLSRYIAFKCCTYFNKNKKVIETFEVWEEVWVERSNWQKGYY